MTPNAACRSRLLQPFVFACENQIDSPGNEAVRLVRFGPRSCRARYFYGDAPRPREIPALMYLFSACINSTRMCTNRIYQTGRSTVLPLFL